MVFEDVNGYELVYIVQPKLEIEAVEQLNKRVLQHINSQSGTVTQIEFWGKRRLAYPIEKQMEGFYVFQRFLMDPTGTNELNRILRLNEDIMRFMLIRNDDQPEMWAAQES